MDPNIIPCVPYDSPRQITESIQRYPYKPPSDEIRLFYAHIIALETILPTRYAKVLFNKVMALFMVIIAVPALILLKILYVVEGIIIPENAVPMLYYYHAVSAGKVVPKYKLRLIKTKFIDPKGVKPYDWLAYSSEWTPESSTFMGSIVKKYYQDGPPQFWSVLKGDMSIVGPRPLSVFNYERDKSQGNVTQSLPKGGLLSLGHINKGTSEMGNPVYEYEYIDQYLNRSSLAVLLLDLWIIWKGVLSMKKGVGH
jgi:lipopolysaccharide/colanic/teichoic acid biosynthesis glycosyltransferase